MYSEDNYCCSITEKILSDEYGNLEKSFGIILTNKGRLLAVFPDICTSRSKILNLSELINSMTPQIKIIPELIEDIIF